MSGLIVQYDMTSLYSCDCLDSSPNSSLRLVPCIRASGGGELQEKDIQLKPSIRKPDNRKNHTLERKIRGLVG